MRPATTPPMTRAELGQSLGLEIDLIPRGRPNRPGTRISPRFLTLHNTGNANRGADARAHARFVTTTGHYRLASGTRRWVSWHYTVDDLRVIKHLPIGEMAWHAGRAGNRSSIGIETCMHAGIDQAAADDRLARLAAVLCHDLGLGIDAIRSHKDWTGKACPVLLLPRWDEVLAEIEGYLTGISEAGTPAPEEAGEIEESAMAEAMASAVT